MDPLASPLVELFPFTLPRHGYPATDPRHTLAWYKSRDPNDLDPEDIFGDLGPNTTSIIAQAHWAAFQCPWPLRARRPDNQSFLDPAKWSYARNPRSQWFYVRSRLYNATSPADLRKDVIHTASTKLKIQKHIEARSRQIPQNQLERIAFKLTRGVDTKTLALTSLKTLIARPRDIDSNPITPDHPLAPKLLPRPAPLQNIPAQVPDPLDPGQSPHFFLISRLIDDHAQTHTPLATPLLSWLLHLSEALETPLSSYDLDPRPTSQLLEANFTVVEHLVKQMDLDTNIPDVYQWQQSTLAVGWEHDSQTPYSERQDHVVEASMQESRTLVNEPTRDKPLHLQRPDGTFRKQLTPSEIRETQKSFNSGWDGERWEL